MMTRLQLLALALVSVVATTGCSDSVAPEHRDLIGNWVSAPVEMQPQGWYRRHFRFTNRGRFVAEVRTYRPYAGQPGDEMSSFTRTEGTYRLDGDRLLFEPERYIWWDGGDSPIRFLQPYPPGGFFNGAVYTVSAGNLTIHYNAVGAADGPVPTTAVYTRVD